MSTAIRGAVLLLLLTGCRESNPQEADLGKPQPDLAAVADAALADAPSVPIADSGLPLYDTKAPPVDAGPVKDKPKLPLKDGTPPAKDKGTVKDAYVPPDLPIANTIKVAAVQYGPGLYSFAPGCSDDVCGLSYFVTQAKNNGAVYIVTPEGALPQQTAELSPNLGDKPTTWTSSPLLKAMSTLADNLGVTVIFNVILQEGSGSAAKLYNSEVAVDGSGTVISRHYKYYLYGEAGITPGTSCCDSFFQTPVGQAGTLICADINCIVDLAAVGNCTTTALNLMNSYAAKKPQLTFFSSFWMSTGSLDPYWQPNQVQSKFAKHASTYMVAANIIYKDYHGGGIYQPDGTPISVANTTTPSIAYGVIPKPGTVVPNPPSTGKIVITELMMNPSAVGDDLGEWIELYNAGTAAVDLGGWTLRSGKAGMADMLSSYQLAPGQYVAVGSNTNKATNGGATVVSAWNSFGLANSSGKVELHDRSGTLIDEVSYGSGWPVPTGASISLKNPSLDNSQPGNWCTEKSAWSGSAGDKGTPGAPSGC
jgi:predicted amidohydrolase